MMCKILLVDDESLIRKGIAKIILREKKYEIYEASNGKEAVELLHQKIIPDIVITDVKMPEMNGIELVKYLDINFPEIKKVVISGFDDFEFVRDTLKNGAYDYILKPIDNMQLIRVLDELEEKIDHEKNEKKKAIVAKNQYRQSIDILKDQALRNIFFDPKYSMTKFMRALDEIGVNYGFLIKNNVFLLIAKLNNYGSILDNMGANEASLQIFALRNICEEVIRTNNLEHLSTQDSNYVIFIIESPQILDIRKALLKQIEENLKKYTLSKFLVYAGKPVSDFESLRQQYDENIAVLKNAISHNTEVLDSFSIDILKIINGYKRDITPFVEKYYSRLVNSIEVANENNIKNIVDEIFEKSISLGFNKIELIKLFNNLYTRIQVSIPDFEKWVYETFGENYFFVNEIMKYDTINEMNSYIYDFYKSVITRSGKTKTRRDKRMIEIVKEYVKEHYNENITLNKISELIFVNPNYFCEIFKQETNQNFVDYLTNVRIEKAKELLKDVRIKVYEVSGMVGYDDATYFSKVFKKIVGVTPTQYRDKY